MLPSAQLPEKQEEYLSKDAHGFLHQTPAPASTVQYETSLMAISETGITYHF